MASSSFASVNKAEAWTPWREESPGKESRAATDLRSSMLSTNSSTSSPQKIYNSVHRSPLKARQQELVLKGKRVLERYRNRKKALSSSMPSSMSCSTSSCNQVSSPMPMNQEDNKENCSSITGQQPRASVEAPARRELPMPEDHSLIMQGPQYLVRPAPRPLPEEISLLAQSQSSTLPSQETSPATEQTCRPETSTQQATSAPDVMPAKIRPSLTKALATRERSVRGELLEAALVSRPATARTHVAMQVVAGIP